MFFIAGAGDHGLLPAAERTDHLSTNDDQTTRTEMTTGYQTEATDVSDQQGGDDDRADANSTPQPPAVHMRYVTFEAARYHSRIFTKEGFQCQD